MFRKIKKIYFKIYHLFKLIGIFIIVFTFTLTVKADTCINLYKGEPGNLFDNLSGGWHNINSSLDSINRYDVSIDSSCDSSTTLCLDSSKQYTFFGLNSDDTYFNLATTGWRQFYIDGYSISLPAGLNPQYYSYTFTPKNYSTVFVYNMNNSTFNNGEALNTLNAVQFAVVEGTEPCIPTTEPEPEPEENVYSNFLTLYLNRITYLAEGFTNNPYLIAMIGIIFGFVVLELLLKILNIRRKK